MDDRRARVGPSEATLDAAALLMTEHGIHQLPVVDGERPVGVVAWAKWRVLA